MNNSIRFVPFSVKMRSAGFVRNPIRSWSLSVPQWIPAPIKIDMVAVDRTVDVLARFVAKWVEQSRRLRREYAVRKAGEDWARGVWAINWGNLMYEEEERILAMTELEFLAEAQFRIARCKASNAGVFPVIEWIRSMRIQREEKKKTQARLVEYSMVAREIGIKVFVGSVFLGYF